MNEADLGKIMFRKHCHQGSVYLSDFGNNMLVVTLLNEKFEIVASKTFVSTEETFKQVLLQAKVYFKQVRECLMQNKIKDIEDIEE